MNSTFKLASALTLAGALFLSGCTLEQMVKMAEEQELTVTPSPLEVHGDSVKFSVSAVLPVKMLKKNKLYTIQTTYAYGDPTQELSQFDFSPVEFPNQQVEQPSKEQNFSMFYEPEMESGELNIVGIASNLDKTKFKETPAMKIADGIITTSRLVQYAYDVTYADHGYNNQEELIPTNVSFQFLKGSARLRSSEVKGQSGQELDAFIAAKNTTRTVTITGTHSPEGLESVNSKLAEDRAKVIKDFYYKKMKQYDYKGMADSIKFETVAVFQKWNAFLNELKSYEGLTEDEKNEVRAIVNGGGDFRSKEKEISKKSYYSKLMKDVYPQLRTSSTQILSVKKKKTDAEINVLASSIIKGSASADTLSYNELMYSATLTPLKDEKIKIYEAAIKAHGTWQAHNNLGAIYLEQAKSTSNKDQKNDLIDKALKQLELAANKEEKAEIYNNLAASYLLQGRRDDAMENYNKIGTSNGATADVAEAANAGKGSIQIRQGNYDKAISMLKNASDQNADAYFNLGLAYLLTKDYSNAEQAFEAAILIDEKHAHAYYCEAISQARQAKIEGVAQNLKSAVKHNASLRDKAIADLEFQKYWDNDAFIGALK